MREALQRRGALRIAARERLAASGVCHGRGGVLDHRPLRVCQGQALLLQPRVQARQLHIAKASHLPV